MTQAMERYLSGVKLWMFGMPRKAKKGIVSELRAHIMDSAYAQGGPAMIEPIVAQMESPRKTAKMYKQIYGYGLPLKILFVLITIFLSIWTLPVWEIVNPNFSTTLVFLILILFLFFVGSRAGKRMALTVGISSLLTRFILLGLLAAALGKNAILQGGFVFIFLLSSIFLILVAYLPARTIEKWEEKRAWDIPLQSAPQPYPTPYPPQPYPNPQVHPAPQASYPPQPNPKAYTAPEAPYPPQPNPQAYSAPQTPYPPQTNPPPNSCPRCGTAIFGATKFCPECGTKLV
jgi:hypothetical protein